MWKKFVDHAKKAVEIRQTARTLRRERRDATVLRQPLAPMSIAAQQQLVKAAAFLEE
jgi:hypothetical protein